MSNGERSVMADSPTGSSPGVPGPSGAPNAQRHGDNHGNSVAAWTSVIVVMFGALIMAVAVLISNVALFVVGVLVVVAGAVAAKVLVAMGFGSSASPRLGPDSD